jgi:hypothetical protein
VAALAPAWLVLPGGVELHLPEEMEDDLPALPVGLDQGTRGAYGTGLSPLSLLWMWLCSNRIHTYVESNYYNSTTLKIHRIYRVAVP